MVSIMRFSTSRYLFYHLILPLILCREDCIQLNLNPNTVEYGKILFSGNTKNDYESIQHIRIDDKTEDIYSNFIGDTISDIIDDHHSTYLIIDFKAKDKINPTDYKTLTDSNMVRIVNDQQLVVIAHSDKQGWIDYSNSTTLNFYLQSNREIISADSIENFILYAFHGNIEKDCDLKIDTTLMAPILKQTLEDVIDTDDGIRGRLVFQFEWDTDKTQKYLISPKYRRFNINFGVCKRLGYAKKRFNFWGNNPMRFPCDSPCDAHVDVELKKSTV